MKKAEILMGVHTQGNLIKKERSIKNALLMIDIKR